MSDNKICSERRSTEGVRFMTSDSSTASDLFIKPQLVFMTQSPAASPVLWEVINTAGVINRVKTVTLTQTQRALFGPVLTCSCW